VNHKNRIYDSQYFLYDSHCIVYSIINFVTRRWPSTSAISCRHLK